MSKLNKKVIKDIIFDSVGELKYGIGMAVNGKSLINMDYKESLKLLKDNNLIKGDDIIIPKGLELTEKINEGGVYEYNFNNGFIIVDLALSNEDEKIYIG